jgi:hypothetical protein
MKGHLLLVLLVATAVAAQTDKTPDKKTGAEPAAAAAAAKKHIKPEAVKTKKEAPAKTKPAEEATAEAQAETKKQPGQTEVAQAKTEAGQGNTEEPQAQTDQDPKLTSVPGSKALGMSILGNQEAPTSLVIVPWKSSEVGRATGISPMLDDSRQPVDKEVFMRELRYYEIRSEKKP